jgi:nucleotide-binding universal stress UspA family protein
MFRKILIAINNATGDRTVFEEGLAIARANHGSLLMLHVLPIETQTRMFPAAMLGYGAPILVEATVERFQEEWQSLEKQGLEMLQILATEAKVAQVPCEYVQLVGSPSTLICDIARDGQVDLIVMGRRGYSGLGELMAGSVSNYVLHHAPCSVLVVQNSNVVQDDQQATATSATVG